MRKKRRVPLTVAGLRARVKRLARAEYRDQPVLLRAELVGIACEVTGIADPHQAVEEIILDALNRWARVLYFDRLASRPSE